MSAQRENTYRARLVEKNNKLTKSYMAHNINIIRVFNITTNDRFLIICSFFFLLKHDGK